MAVALPAAPLPMAALPPTALLVAEGLFWAAALPEAVAEVTDPAVGGDGTAAPAIEPAVAPAMAPEREPARAFSSIVIAADTGSVAECFAEGSPGSSVLAVAPGLAVAVSPGVGAAAGAAASDCASVAEKSSAPFVACAVVFADEA